LDGTDGTISFSHWVFSDLLANDAMDVSVSNDDGASWTPVMTIPPTGSEWKIASFVVSDFVVPTAEIRVRFSIADDPNDSVTEGGIDNFTLQQFICPQCSGAGDCNDGVFCNGVESCNELLCVAGDDPCPGSICSESAQTCVANNPPVVTPIGPRYFDVTPDPGPVDVALLVTSATWPCVTGYVDFDSDPELAAFGIGRLVDDPVYRLPADWGTVHVSDVVVTPDASYSVRTDFDGEGLSSVVEVTTWSWGDTNNSGLPVDFDDIICALDGFAGLFFGGCSFFGTDLEGALTNGTIDFDDVLGVLDAFAGAGFFDNPGHQEPCLNP
ncbi:MAG: hypothetical protein IID36_08475, partial [Planctomycetes bacterium]|nr:hypothetical protein [Planctomycetota bacterium]